MSKKAKRKNGKDYSDFVPIDKMSKKDRKKRNDEQRNYWDIPPATQVIPNKKKNKKQKHKKDDYYEDDYE